MITRTLFQSYSQPRSQGLLSYRPQGGDLGNEVVLWLMLFHLSSWRPGPPQQ